MEHSLSSDLILDSETRTSFSRAVAKLGSESESVMLAVADNRGLRPRNRLTMSYESRTGRPTSHNTLALAFIFWLYSSMERSP